MIGLLQRVTEASVRVDTQVVGSIDAGLMVLVGIEKQDGEQAAARLVEKLLNYRVFADDEGRMNLGLSAVGGGLLLVPQFTLAADTRKGLRPSFASAAPPEQARELFAWLVSHASEKYENVASGVFGADMKVALVNDGPVTFELRV